MSNREIIQEKIYDFLIENRKVFNSPSGIIKYMRPYSRGKVRAIKFGDGKFSAEVLIIKPDCITVNGSGEGIMKYAGKFQSFDELKNKFAGFTKKE